MKRRLLIAVAVMAAIVATPAVHSGVLDIQPDNADDHIAVGTRDVLAVAERGRAHGHRSLTPSDLFIAGRAAIR